jgi:hypothetical protein
LNADSVGVAKIIQATNTARATIFPQQTSHNLEIKVATTQPVEQEIIQRLKKDRQVSFILLADHQLMLDQADPAWTALPLPLKTSMFDEKQRVRVVRLRCILEGVPPSSSLFKGLRPTGCASLV